MLTLIGGMCQIDYLEGVGVGYQVVAGYRVELKSGFGFA